MLGGGQKTVRKLLKIAASDSGKSDEESEGLSSDDEAPVEQTSKRIVAWVGTLFCLVGRASIFGHVFLFTVKHMCRINSICDYLVFRWMKTTLRTSQLRKATVCTN